jgi:hypothetical protein
VSRIGDYLHDAPWYLHKATLPVRNAAYRAARPLRTARGQFRSNRNRRTVARGRRPWTERAASQIASRLPVYRSRINRGTGRPHRDDAAHGRLTDQSLTRLRDAHAQRFMPASSPARAAADKVLGPGRSARAEEAMRQARHDPWADPHRPGRTR